MKKTLSIILTAVMVLGLLAVVPMTVSAAPAGTAVKTEADFLAMAADGTYYLDADITLNDSYAQTFVGTFDGNGKTVTITKNAMFLQVANANISNFTVKGELAPTEVGFVVGSNDFFAAVAVLADGTSTFKNITSDVNFTATLSTTRYGAIAATSGEGHALLIENCINNGNITNDSYAGGVYGWSAKLGNSTIKNCINNGNINLANGYGAGVLCRLAGSGEGGAITVQNCINNGNVTTNHDQAAGIMAYTETPMVTVTGCINNGDILNNKSHAAGILTGLGAPKAELTYVITGNVNNGNVTTMGNKYAGGIVANFANPSIGGTYTISNNINNGNITGAGNDTGGIVGYAYGRGTDATGAYATVTCNVNTGIIKNTKWASQILCYTNQPCTVITDNIAIGSVVLDGTTEPGEGDGQRVIVGLSSADIAAYTVKNNYYFENDGTVYYSYATAADNAAKRIALADRPADSVIFITADKVAEKMAALNTVAGATIYEMKDGKISMVCNHNYLIVDGKCSACGADASTVHIHTLVDVAAVAPTCTEKGAEAGKKCSACDYVEGCAEIAALGHKFEDGKCTVCQAADPDYVAPVTTTEDVEDPTDPVETTTEAPVTEPAPEKGCGGIGVFAALIAIVSGVAVVVFKKKA